jgi:hypothetical protein
VVCIGLMKPPTPLGLESRTLIPRFAFTMLILVVVGLVLGIPAASTALFALGLLLLVIEAGGLSAAWVTYASDGRG